MYIFTEATTISEDWDDAPSLFHTKLSAHDILRIQELHAMITGLDDVCSIDMRIYGLEWALSTSLAELMTEDEEEFFSNDNCNHYDYVSTLASINDAGGVDALSEFIIDKAPSQRVDCMAVTIWGHGTIQFHSTPHCSDSMKVMSRPLQVEDLELGKIYIDGV